MRVTIVGSAEASRRRRVPPFETDLPDDEAQSLIDHHIAIPVRAKGAERATAEPKTKGAERATAEP